MSTSYDELAYSSSPKTQTHPDRLATVAALYGMTAQSVDGCRVLEIGCNDGSNLIPMACNEPRSRFTGIDLASTAIDAARAFSARLQLGNIEFEHADVCHWDAQGRKFDYIIVHGVYSWVPPAAREAILAICAARLEPNGVAYISYNAYPGCHFRRYVWDLVQFHTRHIGEPERKIVEARAIARRMLDQLRGGAQPEAVKEELRTLIEAGDSVLFHDDLYAGNTPFRLGEFAGDAARHGLQYLGDADFSRDVVREPLAENLSWLEQIEYGDYVVGRRFRSSLLCRGEVALDRNIAANRFDRLLAASALEPEAEQPDGTQKFNIAVGKSLSTNHPAVKRMLVDLAARWPDCVPAASLVDGDATLAVLLRLYEAKAIELRTSVPRLTAQVSRRPVASALARVQLSLGGDTVTNQRHTTVQLTDELSRKLVAVMDGSRDRPALVDALAAPDGAAQLIEQRLDANLALAARLCLLVG